MSKETIFFLLLFRDSRRGAMASLQQERVLEAVPIKVRVQKMFSPQNLQRGHTPTQVSSQAIP